jgi:hypothetical protein
MRKESNTDTELEFLDCTVGEFRQHIESQFKEGMTWENYGEWHIDHIIAIKQDKPNMEEVITRLHYTNTQPLWALENMVKSTKSTVNMDHRTPV